MKAKLTKVDTGWILMVDNKIYASHNDILSIKNCQAIERGYDLDKLYEEVVNSDFLDKYEDGVHYYSFIEGFQKALELMDDKKFSESDMIHAYIEGTNDGAQFESMMDYDHSDNSEAQNFSEQAEQDFRKLLQQTEWDVKIEMEYVGECNGNNDNGCFQDSPGHNCGCFERKPKLDADGCLILKRI